MTMQNYTSTDNTASLQSQNRIPRQNLIRQTIIPLRNRRTKMLDIQITQTQNTLSRKKTRINTISFPNSPTILPTTRTTRTMTIHNNIMPNILPHKHTIMQLNSTTLIVTSMLTTIIRSHTTTTNKSVLTTKTTTHRPRIVLTNP